MQKVSLLRCDNYSLNILKEKIIESLKNIEFDFKRLNNARVLIKPNFLQPASDDRAIMTHSEFFKAVVQIVKENNGKPLLVESPAIHSIERVLKKTKYGQIVEEENIEVASPNITKTLHYDAAKNFKHIDISKAYFDADIIISLPKFKTHGITYITGGVKLLFGAIPGLEKSKMHLRLPVHSDFSDFLLDLYGAMKYGLKPEQKIISIMDAIMVLEGDGPGVSGKPRKMDAILASESAIAIDYVATKVAGLDINKVVTIVNGFARNYGLKSPDEIAVIGDGIEELKLENFEPATGSSIFSNAFRWPFNTKTFKNLCLEKPVPQEEKCTLCYQCKKICPAKAIEIAKYNKKIPSYDYKECIRCYCCLEICPEAAIEKKKGTFQWLMGGW